MQWNVTMYVLIIEDSVMQQDLVFSPLKKKTHFFKMYKPIVQEEYEDSCNTAILEEVGLYENLDGLDIITMHGMDGEKMLHKKKPPVSCQLGSDHIQFLIVLM